MLRLWKRAVASSLAALVVLGAPGFGAYRAAAQVVRVPVAAELGSVRVGLAPTAPALSLTPSLLAAPSLSATPFAPAPLPPAAPMPVAPAPAAAAPPIW